MPSFIAYCLWYQIEVDKAVDLQVFQKQIKVFLLATKGDDDTLATFYNTWRARKDTKLQIYVEYTKWVFEPGH